MADKTTKASVTPDTSEWEKGYRGTVPDETPNRAYTIAGVTSGAETPETKAPGSEGSTKVDPNAEGRRA